MDKFKGLKDRYYFVTPLNHITHKSLCDIPTRVFDDGDYSPKYSFFPSHAPKHP